MRNIATNVPITKIFRVNGKDHAFSVNLSIPAKRTVIIPYKNIPKIEAHISKFPRLSGLFKDISKFEVIDQIA